jgi:hypothetical protein
MPDLRTEPRHPRRTPLSQKPRRKNRRTDASHSIVPEESPGNESKTAIPQPAAGLDDPAVAYELMLAIPIRLRCFAIRRYAGQTSGLSFQVHCVLFQKDRSASSDRPWDPFD